MNREEGLLQVWESLKGVVRKTQWSFYGIQHLHARREITKSDITKSEVYCGI